MHQCSSTESASTQQQGQSACPTEVVCLLVVNSTGFFFYILTVLAFSATPNMSAWEIKII